MKKGFVFNLSKIELIRTIFVDRIDFCMNKAIIRVHKIGPLKNMLLRRILRIFPTVLCLPHAPYANKNVWTVPKFWLQTINTCLFHIFFFCFFSECQNQGLFANFWKLVKKGGSKKSGSATFLTFFARISYGLRSWKKTGLF